jgi:HrpJ-like domain
MALSGIQQPLPQQTQIGGAASQGQQAPTQQGSYQNQVVTAFTSESLFEDQMEELGAVAAEKEQHKSEKGLDERKLSERPATLEAVQKVEEVYEHYKQQLPDLDERRLQRLSERLRQGGQGQQNLHQELESFHQDVSYQEVALEYLAATLQQAGADPEGTSDDDRLLKQVLGQIAGNKQDTAKFANIQAGLNVTQAAIEAAGPNAPREQQNLRDLYRDGVVSAQLQNKGIKETCSLIIKRAKDVPGSNFTTQLEFYKKALSAEIKLAENASVDPKFIHELRGQMWSLQFLHTLQDRFTKSAILVDKSDRLQ